MAKYAIRVIEKLARTVIIEAEDLDTANAEVQSAYEKGEINLDSDDFEEYELAPAGWSDNGKVPKGRDVSLFDKIQQNTCIGYLYRDASNYKVYNKAIVPGRFQRNRLTGYSPLLMMGNTSFRVRLVSKKKNLKIQLKMTICYLN